MKRIAPPRQHTIRHAGAGRAAREACLPTRRAIAESLGIGVTR